MPMSASAFKFTGLLPSQLSTNAWISYLVNGAHQREQKTNLFLASRVFSEHIFSISPTSCFHLVVLILKSNFYLLSTRKVAVLNLSTRGPAQQAVLVMCIETPLTRSPSVWQHGTRIQHASAGVVAVCRVCEARHDAKPFYFQLLLTRAAEHVDGLRVRTSS